ncbi:hypothetical protein L211DRAFT_848000 [Terfezia boudieri ATCC MYA-4762]|uniref:Uncharacterized protein n=1 Tax=Terfezia boudieri ATCC MYA-4762 TaxID=1051890 RepID=A0A3N4LS78_9PEZI|nr:hypothetical protein L211DRAFT_848000 [Terfezia boudieri ATCC MYA-4762]
MDWAGWADWTLWMDWTTGMSGQAAQSTRFPAGAGPGCFTPARTSDFRPRPEGWPGPLQTLLQKLERLDPKLWPVMLTRKAKEAGMEDWKIYKPEWETGGSVMRDVRGYAELARHAGGAGGAPRDVIGPDVPPTFGEFISAVGNCSTNRGNKATVGKAKYGCGEELVGG